MLWKLRKGMNSIGEEVIKVIVFDLGGTLMEYKGMPLSWNDYYYEGLKKVNEVFNLQLSENELQEAADILRSYNPRISKREHEIAPEIIFGSAIENWKTKPKVEAVIDTFFKGLNLKSDIFDYTLKVIQNVKKQGYKIACLTDLPNGMPDRLFKNDIAEILDLFDLYVSSQNCGVRKPNKEGLCLIARTFGVDVPELLFVGDEEKDYMTAENAGCSFMFIDDFLKEQGLF